MKRLMLALALSLPTIALADNSPENPSQENLDVAAKCSRAALLAYDTYKSKSADPIGDLKAALTVASITDPRLTPSLDDVQVSFRMLTGLIGAKGLHPDKSMELTRYVFGSMSALCAEMARERSE